VEQLLATIPMSSSLTSGKKLWKESRIREAHAWPVENNTNKNVVAVFPRLCMLL
jgi:hypothetical protein